MEVLWREAEVPPTPTLPPPTPVATATSAPVYGAPPPGAVSSIRIPGAHVGNSALASGGLGVSGPNGPGMHPALLKMMGGVPPAAARGGPMGGTAGLASSSSRPVHVQSNAESKQNTHLLPVVNEKEGVHQYFTLTL